MKEEAGQLSVLAKQRESAVQVKEEAKPTKAKKAQGRKSQIEKRK